ncbi:MAG: peptidoglycan-N-acetylglucosamine deacetylase [Ruminococcaceae bacterium]|nr:peptidoglycan-N-acetylglucosamine deacetylase [Oscillospiraceae bacterium]
MHIGIKIAAALLATVCVQAGAAFDSPRIEFDRESYDELTVEYGEPLPAHEIAAVCRGRLLHRGGVPLDVTVEQPDVGAPGVYEVRYTAAYGKLTAGGAYPLRVVDTTPPELTVDEDTLTASARDRADGDLTDRVVVTDQGEKIVFSVTDSSGNRAEKTVLRDLTPPVLTLGDGLLDFTCVDAKDGDLYDRVRLRESGGVLYYEAADRQGNVATAEKKIAGSGHVAYLTFDDGPGPYTAGLLDTLARYDVKATFFVVGRSEYLDLLPRMKAEGHSIAAHTYSHDYARVYASVDSYFDDLDRVQQKIEEQVGERTALVRFPGGSSNTVSRQYTPGIMTQLSRMLGERGLVYFDWNVSGADTSNIATTESVAGNIKNGIWGHDVSVVLQHDVKDFSVAAVEEILRWGKENGVVFLPLTPESSTAHHRIGN